jgi:uncharacterized protein (TIGR03083 family)
MEPGDIYAEIRQRVSELARSLSAEDLAAKLPTCPDWSTRDVIGHMTGLVVDVKAKKFEGAGTPPWTQAQVEAFADRSLEEVLTDWEALAKDAEGDLVGVLGPFGLRLVSDAYAHEQDIRGAFGRTGHRDSAAVPLAMSLQMETLAQRLADAGLPALRLRTSDGRLWTAGEGEPGATVTAPNTWELLRSLLARRSRAQVAALDWHGEQLDRYLTAFFRFEPPQEDIVE